jgi:hypothetical protein
MADLQEMGFWIVATGAAGTLVWNVLNYIRQPTFIRRTSYDELVESNERMRAEMVQLRSEIVGLRGEIIESKNVIVESKAEIRRLLAECEFWRDQYRELKAKMER